MFAPQEMLKRCFKTCIIVVLIGFAINTKGQESKANQSGDVPKTEEPNTDQGQPVGRGGQQIATKSTPTPPQSSLLANGLGLGRLILPGTGQSINSGKAAMNTGSQEQSQPLLRGQGQIQMTSDGDNPDIPSGIAVDEATYFRLRNEHLRLLRGIPDLIANPRARFDAVRQMERQERLMRDQMKSLAPGAGAAALNLAPVWTSLGPAPIPHGQTGNGSSVSGRVTAIAVDPTDSNIVYVGTAQAGLYRTLDGGANWTPLMDSAKSLAVGAVTIDPLDRNKVFVGTGEANFSPDSFFGVGVYLITNATSSSPTLSGPFNSNGTTDVFTGRAISKILIDPADDNKILVSTTLGISGVSGDFLNPPPPPSGIYLSINALSTSPTFVRQALQPASTGGDITDMAMDPGNPGRIVVNAYNSSLPSEDGLWVSTSGDPWAATASWTHVVSKFLVIGKLAVNRSGSPLTTFFATFDELPSPACANNARGTMFRSSDGGVTWSETTAARGFCHHQCFYDMAIAVDPNNVNSIYLGGQDGTGAGSCNPSILSKSADGATFSPIGQNLHADSHVIAIAPSNSSIIYTGNDGGIFKSIDAGSTWQSINTPGFSATQFQSLAVHPTDPNFMIGGTQDNGTEFLLADGKTWQFDDNGDGGFSAIDQNATDTTNVTRYHTKFNSTDPLLGPQIGFLRATIAPGSNWNFLGCNITSNNGIGCSDAVLFYAPLVLGPGKPNTVYFGTDHLYRSSDSGTTNLPASQILFVDSFLRHIPISAIGISPQDDNVRLVGLRNGKLFATTTGSNTLTDISGNWGGSYIARAVIDPNNKNTAYITLDGYGLSAHIWKTTNLSGAPPTWTAIGTAPPPANIPDIPVNAFVIDAANSNNLYAGTDMGVYASTDGGTSWSPYGNGLPRVAVFDMAIVPASHKLRIATHGRGIWEVATIGQTQDVGFFDSADCNALVGWAADKNSLNQSISVDIYDGATLIATVPANQSRPDVGAFLSDNGLHGFSIATPASLKDGAIHSVSVKFAGTSTALSNSPKSLSCSAASFKSWLDRVDCTAISGWAATTLNQSANVDIYDGAILIATVAASQSRPDVGTFLGDNGLHGFSIAIPASLKDGATHSVSVKFSGTTVSLNNSPQSLSCSSASFKSWLDRVDCTAISGWAATTLNQSINVDIYDGATLIATVAANQSRPDVGTFLGDNGLHGFSVATPASLKNGTTHSISVKFGGTSTALNNSPQPVSCVGNNLQSWLDVADCNTISGWAADTTLLNQSLNVDIYDGATLLTTAAANQSRPDVGAFLGDNGLHGFRIGTPASLKDGATHSVAVKFGGTSTALANSPKIVSACAGSAPTVTTNSPPSAVTTNSATLPGTVNPNGSSTTVWFLYALNASMTGAVQTPPQGIGAGTTALAFSANIAGLSPNTTYFYQAVASSSAGTTNGAVFSFATAAPPLTGSLSPSNPTVGITSANITGTASPNATVSETETWPDGTSHGPFFAGANASGNYNMGPFVLQQLGTYRGVLHDSVSGANTPINYSGTGDFTTSVNVLNQTVSPGQSTSYTVTFTSISGFSGTIIPAALNWSQIPGATASWSPTSVAVPANGSAIASFILNTAASTTPGTYSNIILQGANGSVTHAASPVSLTVKAPPPAITQLTPNPVPVGSAKLIGIFGTGFQPGGRLHFTWTVSGGGFSDRLDYTFVNSGFIEITINTGTIPSTGWTVQMINSDGQNSNVFPFSVN